MDQIMPNYAFMRIAMLVAVVALLPSLAAAQGFAVRTGVNMSPDQIAVGAQYQWQLTDRLWFRPNSDVGFGNGATLVGLNSDVVYRAALTPRSRWSAFLGGGTGLNCYRMTGYNVTLSGVNVLAGIMLQSGLFAQATAGFLDSPRLKLGVGYAFHPTPQTRKRTPRR